MPLKSTFADIRGHKKMHTYTNRQIGIPPHPPVVPLSHQLIKTNYSSIKNKKTMLRYKLVQKKNFTKGAAADSKLYYAMSQSSARMEHEAPDLAYDYGDWASSASPWVLQVPKPRRSLRWPTSSVRALCSAPIRCWTRYATATSSRM